MDKNKMVIGQAGVKYGLTVRKPPGKAKPAPPPAKPNLFGDDDASDGDDVERQIARHAARKQSDKKVAEMHAAALAEDASIFDYDTHFDSIQEARSEPQRQEKIARQSRYIASLLEKAEERKREQDVLYEKQLAKERAAEDHLYGEKEKFITSAYRKKLEEEEKWKAEAKRKQQEEEANAVEKRGHMGDFYRNLLRNNVAFGGAEPAKKPAVPAAAVPAVPAVPAARRDGSGGGAAPREEDIMPERRAEMAAAKAAAAAPFSLKREVERREALPGASGVLDRGAMEDAGEGGPVTREAPPAAASDAEAEKRESVTAEEPAGGVRRSREDAVAAAKERYLARKRKAETLG